jgi:uncharacterized membrane protein
VEVLLVLLLGAIFVLVLPGLAIHTYLRLQRQTRALHELSEHTYGLLTRRVFELERKVATLEGVRDPVRAPADDPRADAAAAASFIPSVPSSSQTPLERTDSAADAATPATDAAVLPHAETGASGSPTPVRRGLPSIGSTPARRPDIDWESLIAGRWMNLVGILALILAVAFFLRYAFENQWIGPAGRVSLGLLAGTALLVWSEVLFRRTYAYFSEGIAGLGGGVLYLSLYAGWGYYDLFPQPASFTGMVAVTVALMALAWGRRSERIALVGLLGGFLAPVVLSTGTNQQIVLFSYVAALDAGALALARFRRWRMIEPAAFVATQLLFWGWYFRYWTPDQTLSTVIFATLFFVLFSALPLVRLHLLRTLPGEDDRVPRPVAMTPARVVLPLTNAFAFLFALRATLWPDHVWTLTLAVLALGAAHLVAVRLVPHGPAAEAAAARLLYGGLALTFATLAIPIRLEGRWITIAWAIEGAVLIWSGFTTHVRQLRAAGLALLAIVVYRLLASPIPADRVVLNARFLTLVAVAACLTAAVSFARARRDDYFAGEGHAYAGAAIAANVLLVWALTTEVWDGVGRLDRPFGMSSFDLRQLALPLVWALYGSALLIAGCSKGLPGLRWQGFPLVTVATGALLVQSTTPDLVILNPRFFVYVVTAIAVLMVARVGRQRATSMSGSERQLYLAAPVVVHVLLLTALSHEVWDVFGRLQTVEDVRYAQSMGLSLLWAVYATGLIVAGMRGSEPLLRWMALLLFGIVVVKVFFLDLSVLERGYRILSFFVLGVLLLGVSFLYTRRLASSTRGGEL